MDGDNSSPGVQRLGPWPPDPDAPAARARTVLGPSARPPHPPSRTPMTDTMDSVSASPGAPATGAGRGWARDPVVWAGLLLTGLALSGLAQLLAVTVGAPTRDVPEIAGVRLGMTPDAVRASFRPPADGAGRFRSFAEEDVAVLVWEPAGDASPEAASRFEFHAGVLVAIDTTVSPGHPLAGAAGAAGVVARDHWVLQRHPPTSMGDEKSRPTDTRLTMYARDCPAHAEEVARLLDRR